MGRLVDRQATVTVTEAISRLAPISTTSPLSTIAFRIASVASTVLPGLGTGVAITTHTNVLGFEFSRPGLASTLDERQFPSGYGPVLQAAHRNQRVVVDASHDGGFADYQRMIARHGVYQVQAWPLRPAPTDTPTGALSVYRATGSAGPSRIDHQFDEFLIVASVLMADALRYHGAVQTAEQLKQAMQSRAVIEQAKGMIMASTRCSDEAAFDQLKHMSSATNRKLRDVAASMVRDVIG